MIRGKLDGQTLLVIGGTSGIGLEIARCARAEGANLIITPRDAERLQRVGRELGASIAAFDVLDFGRLERFFDELKRPIDHLLVTGPGPGYAPLTDLDFDETHRDVDAHLWLPLHIAREARTKERAPENTAHRHRRRPAIDRRMRVGARRPGGKPRSIPRSPDRSARLQKGQCDGF